MNRPALGGAALASVALGIASVGWVVSPATARQLVDPDTLVPPPPPGAECWQTGQQTICHTDFVEQLDDELVDLGLPCGPFHETMLDVRRGLRWYDAEGKLVRRTVSQDMEGTWSLSPGEDLPAVHISAHGGWGETYLVPGDLDSALGSSWGEGFKLAAPGHGVIVHIAGMDNAEGFHGTFTVPEDPSVGDDICAALLD